MYLLTFTIQNQLVLSLRDNAIAAYHTSKEGLDAFKGFTDKFGGGHYESAISATLGMMSIQPQLVEFNKPVENIKPYLLDKKPYKYSGMLGSFDIIGTPLKKEFLIGRNIISIWKESMIAAGISDPLESVITDPIKFSL